MGRFFALLRYQIRALFIAPSTYAAAFLFTLLMGGIYMLSLIDVSSSGGGKSPIDLFLQLFWFPVLFMVPMLTMRSIAEERRMGTLQALMTTPVSAFEIVFAKFLACYMLYIFFWLLTLFFPIVTVLSLPETGVDDRIFSISQIVLGYTFIFVSGAMYVAIGVFASSLTRSTLVAGMLSFCILFIALTGSAIAYKFVLSDPSWGVLLESTTAYLQTFRHLEDFGKALLDTRPFFLYFSSAAAFIAVTALITENKAS
jgi:ABC-type Na+ efflux pump, permease component